MPLLDLPVETLNTLVWLIPLPPLAAFFIILLFTRRSKGLSDVVAVMAILLTWVIALVVFFTAITRNELGHEPIESSIAWLPLGDSAETSLSMGVLIDPLGALMLFFVP